MTWQAVGVGVMGRGVIMVYRALRAVALACAVAVSAAHAPFAHASQTGSWPSWGGPSSGNQRQAVAETIISPATAGRLHSKWSVALAGNITATPTIEGGRLYVTDDWGGLYCLEAATGKQVWMHFVSDYTGYNGSASRSSPAVAGNLIIIADRRSNNVLGIDRASGALVWQTQVETNPYVTLTASPVVYGKSVYVGTSSNEEYIVSVSPSYVPSFRGSVVSLDTATGHVNWQTSMVPSGYTGGAVWGSGFAVSASRNLLYVATGNNYTLPQSTTDCIGAAPTQAGQKACLDRHDYVDSVVALDLATGQVKWDRRLQGLDTFNLNCTSSTPAQPCPTPTGPDYDFASAPNLLTVTAQGSTTQLVGAGQKSGIYWALNPDTGAVVWHSRPAPGGGRGGIMWGSAVDATQVYVAENDANKTAYKLLPSGVRTKGGSWAALDVATGAVRWQTAALGTAPGQSNVPSGAEGAMSVANGVVFGGSAGGFMVAMDAGSGSVLWSFQSGAGVTCGPAIADGIVYWGSGDPYGTQGKTLYAFTTAP